MIPHSYAKNRGKNAILSDVFIRVRTGKKYQPLVCISALFSANCAELQALTVVDSCSTFSTEAPERCVITQESRWSLGVARGDHRG